jgi:predicted Rossmann fold nucleotide-binding protein DprA/Smf involved in DNA uptake
MMEMTKKTASMVKDVVLRMFATFTASALSIISGAAIIGDIEMHKAALLAGFVAVAQVAEKLARASMDGELTKEEIDEAFLGARIKRETD